MADKFPWRCLGRKLQGLGWEAGHAHVYNRDRTGDAAQPGDGASATTPNDAGQAGLKDMTSRPEQDRDNPRGLQANTRKRRPWIEQARQALKTRSSILKLSSEDLALKTKL